MLLLLCGNMGNYEHIGETHPELVKPLTEPNGPVLSALRRVSELAVGSRHVKNPIIGDPPLSEEDLQAYGENIRTLGRDYEQTIARKYRELDRAEQAIPNAEIDDFETYAALSELQTAEETIQQYKEVLDEGFDKARELATWEA